MSIHIAFHSMAQLFISGFAEQTMFTRDERHRNGSVSNKDTENDSLIALSTLFPCVLYIV